MSMMNYVFNEAPRTSYLKAIDVWMITCFCFTSATLLEYCLHGAVPEQGKRLVRTDEERKGQSES